MKKDELSAQSIISCAVDSQLTQSIRSSQITLFTLKRTFSLQRWNYFLLKKKKHFNAHNILGKSIGIYNISIKICYKFLYLPKLWYLEFGGYDFAESLISFLPVAFFLF